VTRHQILLIAAVTNLVLIIGLSVGTAVIKLWRRGRERRRTRELAALRPVLLRYLADWENGEATDLAETLINHRSGNASFEELVAGLLPKLRGADRSVLVDILRRRGTIEQACRDTRFHTSLRRALSAELLGSAGAVEGIPHVSRLLGDRNRQVRLAAVRALGRIGTAESATALITHLDQAEAGIPPQPVTMSLLRMGTPAAGPLRTALDAKQATVRTMAAEVLGVLGVIEAADALERILRNDCDLTVRIGAAHALGRMGLPSSVPLLIRALKVEHHPELLGAACTALGQIGNPEAIPALEWAIGHTTPAVRIAAAQALLALGPAGLARLRSMPETANGGDAAREVLARNTILRGNDRVIDLTPVQLEFRFR
jgi:HEAT repeat protein